jgi:ABC-2 type transport system ATP-binding protein
MTSPIIETQALKKTFGRVEAVCSVDLAVPAGSICGFLGRNGAGKSTTIKMLLGMVWPTSGAGRVFGKDIRDPRASLEIRSGTGFVGEDKRLYHYMTVEQIIRFTRSFYPTWRHDLERELLHQFQLPLDRRTGQLSKGMRTKLAMLLAMARGASLLILDEPTEGLDPVAVEEVLQLLVRMAAEGATIFFSSHQIAEVEQIADYVSIIEQGRILVQEPLDQLKTRHRRIQLLFERDGPRPPLSAPGIVAAHTEGRTVSMLAGNNLEEILDQARALRPVSLQVIPASLKEIFLETVKAKH